MVEKVTIGVLGIQGDVSEHVSLMDKAIKKTGVHSHAGIHRIIRRRMGIGRCRRRNTHKTDSVFQFF